LYRPEFSDPRQTRDDALRLVQVVGIAHLERDATEDGRRQSHARSCIYIDRSQVVEKIIRRLETGQQSYYGGHSGLMNL
jgi:hypothetical protein